MAARWHAAIALIAALLLMHRAQAIVEQVQLER